MGVWKHISKNYTMVIHTDKGPKAEHVRSYNGPSASEITATVSGPEDGEGRGRDIILRRRAALLNIGHEALHRVPFSHSP